MHFGGVRVKNALLEELAFKPGLENFLQMENECRVLEWERDL